jgi:hypothetical protein
MTGPRIVPPEYDTVIRRIDRSWSALERLLTVVPPDAEQLQIDQPFTTACGTPLLLRTTGRLYGRGARILRYTRVHVEVMAWSRERTEVRLRPRSRRLPRWGARRQRRYFEIAHRTADELAEALDDAVARMPMAA